MKADGMNRRELIQRGGALGGLLALSPLLASTADAAPLSTAAKAAMLNAPKPANGGVQLGRGIYESIGVRPMINGRGTFTIISGSLMLPEVRAALDEASKHYVHLDELADAVGHRLAKLTGAEFGMVSSGCSAGLTHATAACVAGGNPDLHIQIPDLTGFQKTEVIISKHSRNVYEAAVSAVGVTVVEVDSPAELEAALGPQTAMIYIMAGPRVDESDLNTEAIAKIAKPHGVPILVDAAAEILTVPNVHLQRGADLVGYSGGKCLRGPQPAGLILGRKDLVRAAWVHSAPHHGFARGFKVGKEETMAMLMAVEMWVRRDHDREYKRWTSWLNHISAEVTKIRGVRTTIEQPDGLSNHTPSLLVLWDKKKLKVSGKTIMDTLYNGEPRIAINETSQDDPPLTGVSITPYMMSPGDERTIAKHLVRLLRNPPPEHETPVKPPAADLSGRWNVQIDYVASSSSGHVLRLTQNGSEITGTHQGEFVTRELSGSISGNEVTLSSSYGESHGDSLSFKFSGKADGNSMGGALDMGEYLAANWKAERA